MNPRLSVAFFTAAILWSASMAAAQAALGATESAEAGVTSSTLGDRAIEAIADRAQMEEFLLRGRMGRTRSLSIGVTRSAKASITWEGKSHDAHVQTVDTFIEGKSRYAKQTDSYRYNVAAYRLDRMLGLGMVPVSVQRRVGGRPAAVTWWVDDVEMMEIDRRKLGRKPIDTRRWNQQMYRAAVFQELISNSDPNQTNQLITKDWTIWLIDFTRAFRVYRKLTRPESLRHLDPELRAALERLDRDGLRREMRGLLDPAQIAALLERRNLILEHFAAGAGSAAGS